MTNTIEMMEINDEMVYAVNGGTFTPNKYEENEYHNYGIKTNYNWILKDEFTLPDGTKTYEDGANAYVEKQKKAIEALKNTFQSFK